MNAYARALARQIYCRHSCFASLHAGQSTWVFPLTNPIDAALAATSQRAAQVRSGQSRIAQDPSQRALRNIPARMDGYRSTPTIGMAHNMVRTDDMRNCKTKPLQGAYNGRAVDGGQPLAHGTRPLCSRQSHGDVFNTRGRIRGRDILSVRSSIFKKRLNDLARIRERLLGCIAPCVCLGKRRHDDVETPVPFGFQHDEIC